MSERTLVITIDGPAGSGKSTVARRVARALGIAYLDTGAMYRALTWAALEVGVDSGDEPGLVTLFDAANLEITDDGRILWDSRDISTEIRTSAVARHVSQVASLAQVRERMVEAQRAYASARSLVSEGRDQGTIVFPSASLKVFLIADLEARARRRTQDLAAAGEEVEQTDQEVEISRRDESDSQRGVGPLAAPEGAAVIDSTHMSVDDVTQAVLALVPGATERVNPQPKP